MQSRSFHSLVALLPLLSSASAWINPSLHGNTRQSIIYHKSTTTTTATTTTTQLYMFDWFNPKPKSDDKEKKTPGNTENFLGNFFNTVPPPKHAEPHEKTVEKDEPPVPVVAAKEAAVEEKVTELPKTEVVTKETPPPVEKEEQPTAISQQEKDGNASKTNFAATTTTKSSAPSHEIHRGKVRWFDRSKGYGMIDPIGDDELSKKPSRARCVFVHQSDLQAEGFRYLFNGEEVEFVQLEDDQGRFKAIHVTGLRGSDLRITEIRKNSKDKEATANKQ